MREPILGALQGNVSKHFLCGKWENHVWTPLEKEAFPMSPQIYKTHFYVYSVMWACQVRAKTGHVNLLITFHFLLLLRVVVNWRTNK